MFIFQLSGIVRNSSIHLNQLLRLSRNSQVQRAANKSAMFSTKSSSGTDFKSIKYWVDDRVAHIQLNRPARLNAIDIYMPVELETAVDHANNDDNVKVLLLYGKDSFCSGYDLKDFAEQDSSMNQDMPWDPYLDFKFMSRCNRAWMSLWHSLKPVVCKIKGVAIGGGSDMALCCDVTFMAENARIGYPPSRVWGCPTTAMWVYRLGMEKAKRVLFTGCLLSGREAAEMGLIGESVPEEELDKKVDDFIQSIIEVPTNQLFFQKQVINQAVEQMGVLNTQRLATVFDGMTRHTPEGMAFQYRAAEVGFKQAVKERDSQKRTAWSNKDDLNKSKL